MYTRYLHIRVTPQQARRLTLLAKHEGTTRSAVLRALVEEATNGFDDEASVRELLRLIAKPPTKEKMP